MLSLAIMGCGGDPQGPDAGVDPVAYTPVNVGDTTSAGLAATTAEASFSFRVTEAGQLALFALADGTISLTVSDSAADQTPAGVQPLAIVYPAGPAGAVLLERRTDRFMVQPGRTYAIRARHAFNQNETTRFRMFLYRVNPAPEHRPAEIALSDTVTGEWLENSADVDEFLLTVQAGAELIGYVQGEDPANSGEVSLVARRPDGSELASTGSDAGATDLEGSATGRFIVPSDGTYRIALQGGLVYSPSPAPGGYRFQMSAVNRAPESGPAVVAVNDTVAGSLEHVGDVDEFTLMGTPGQEINLFFQGLTDEVCVLQAELAQVDNPQVPVRSLDCSGRDTSLYAEASGTLLLPSSGSLVLRIMGRDDRRGIYQGNYRFFPYPINRAPESGSAALTLGDSVSGVIDLPGDVDEFQLTVPTTGLVNLVFVSPTGRGQLTLTRLDVTGTIPLATQTIFGTATGQPQISTTGAFELAQSVYRVRVESGSTPGAFVGPYRIATHAIHREPENVSATVTYDVPVTGEAISPMGDFDEYTFTGAKGDVLTGWLQPGSGPTEGAIALSVLPVGGLSTIASVGQNFGRDSAETGRFILPASGSYIVSVGGAEGPYRFTVHRLDTQPEHTAAAIAPGASVTTEQLDRPGDVDEFVLSAATGSELQVMLQAMSNVLVRLEVDMPVTYDSLKGAESLGFPQPTGRFLMPAGGEARLRIYNSGGSGGTTGPYSFSVIPVVRAPESVGAPLTRGVVVQGESLDYPGDIDEFTFTATAGETIAAFLQTPQGFNGSGEALLEVVEPGTGAVLGTATSYNPTPGPFGASTGPITLTASGVYRLRVRCTNDRGGAGVYEVMAQ
jgi:hypothetical protein